MGSKTPLIVSSGWDMFPPLALLPFRKRAAGQGCRLSKEWLKSDGIALG